MAGFLFPKTQTGKSSLIPEPPWHYSGEMITVEYRTSPDRVSELLPEGATPADEDPGAVALIWADWQSCGDTFEETLDELRVPRSERPQLGRDYLQAVARLGLD